MGASHAVISLADVSPSNFDDQYFRDAGISWPDGAQGARNPTPRDLRTVLRRLGGYSIEYSLTGHSLDVTVSSTTDAQDWAVIWIEGYTGEVSEDTPLSLSFHRGNVPLVLRIVTDLARICGPFLVMLNFEEPRLVTG